ncbi:plastid transcriptionally active 18 [Euphorbia peplus]|nr:plastid transcriptionally active 18 [Euphorbia peplus]
MATTGIITIPSPALGFSTPKSSNRYGCRFSRQSHEIKAMHTEKSLEELYNVKVERKVSPKRLQELGVSRWSVWKTGKCKLPWDWQVDQLVYIEEGEVRVVPEGSERYMQFLAGDLVRYPKWLEADLFFNAPYQERYSFRAYGDDV